MVEDRLCSSVLKANRNRNRNRHRNRNRKTPRQGGCIRCPTKSVFGRAQTASDSSETASYARWWGPGTVSPQNILMRSSTLKPSISSAMEFVGQFAYILLEVDYIARLGAKMFLI